MDSFFVCSLLVHSSCFAFKIMSSSIKSHARSERLFSSRCVLEKTFHSRERAFFLGDEFKENTPRTKGRSSVRKRVRAHARTFARSRSDARLHSPENNTCGEFPVFQKLQFRVFVGPETIKSDIRLPQNIQRFHVLRLSHTQRERERLNPSLVASHHEYHRVLFLNKNTI